VIILVRHITFHIQGLAFNTARQVITELIRAYDGTFIAESMNIATISIRLLTFGRTRSRIETFGTMVASSIRLGPVMILGTSNTFNLITIILVVPKHMPRITTIDSNHSFYLRIAIADKFHAILQIVPLAYSLPNPFIITVCSTSPTACAMNAGISHTRDIQENYQEQVRDSDH